MSEPTPRWVDGAALASLLDPLTSLALAVLDADGRVLHANRGFRRAIGATEVAAGMDAASRLVLPTFDTLRDAGPDDAHGTVHRGRITLAPQDGEATTLIGEVRRFHGGYLLVAEHDVEQLQSMARTMVRLNEQMAQTQRDLVTAQKELEARERKLETLAVTDPLTGLSNRRHLDRRLDEEVARSERSDHPLSVLMIDLDHFKAFNDMHGHGIGDAALETVARVLVDHSRPYDTVSRYGGEEFAVVLSGTDVQAAKERAEDIRAAIERAPISGVEATITTSIGVAPYRGGSPMELLRAADDALYEAKRAGRNRVGVART